MAIELTALDPKELVLVLVALIGIAPVIMLRKSQSQLFVAGYLLLCVGAVATNVEAFVLGDFFNFVEHGAGIAAAGIVFFVAAYTQRQKVVAEGE